jgi:uncharacterized protein
MSASENKKLLQEIFAEMSKGNTRPFIEALAEDVRWTLTGKTKWSKTYDGLEAVQTQLLGPVFANFADQYTSRAHRFIAEDDLVVVECEGRVNTHSGKPYNNTYCFIYRVADGKIKEITEYFDTALAVSVLSDGNWENIHAVSANGHSQDSIAAILKLYELRRDEKMRAARAWYFSEFAPTSGIDIARLYRDGEQASAYFRMITSFWDMASSFVLNGGIDEKMFLDANTEHIFVYAKIEPFLGEIRQLFGEPDYLLNLETLVRKIPNIEAKLENRRRLISFWTKENKELSAGEGN